MGKLKVVNPEISLNLALHTRCIIYTSTNNIMLQKRPNTWPNYPGYISAFGGTIQRDETPLQAIIRELAEELGATVHPKELIFLNAYTYEMTPYNDVVFGYFWHDKKGTITGCYQGESYCIKHLCELKEFPLIVDDVPSLIAWCIKRQLIAG